MKAYTTTVDSRNSVQNMLNILSQANPNSLVKNEKGQLVSAYLNPIDMSIVIVIDEEWE